MPAQATGTKAMSIQPTYRYVIGSRVTACLSNGYQPPLRLKPPDYPTHIHMLAMDSHPPTGRARIRPSLHQSSFRAQLQTFLHGEDVPTHCIYQDLLDGSTTGWHLAYLRVSPDMIMLGLDNGRRDLRTLRLMRPAALASFDLAVELAPHSLRLPSRKARFVITLNAPTDANAPPFATITELLQPWYRWDFTDDCVERRQIWTSARQYVTTLKPLPDGNILVTQAFQTASFTASTALELA